MQHEYRAWQRVIIFIGSAFAILGNLFGRG